jgi:hypothetical protein
MLTSGGGMGRALGGASPAARAVFDADEALFFSVAAAVNVENVPASETRQ